MMLSSPSYAVLQKRDTDESFAENHSIETETPPEAVAVLVKGEHQPTQFRDKWFAGAFYIHLIVVGTLAMTLGREAFSDMDDPTSNGVNRYLEEEFRSLLQTTTEQDGDNSTEDVFDGLTIEKVLFSLTAPLVIAPVMCCLAMRLMSEQAESMIRFSLIFNIGLNLLFGCIFGVFYILWAFIPFAVITAILIWYTVSVWHRIPYAAANLKTGIRATNFGLVLVSMGGIPVLIIFSIFWLLAVVGLLSTGAFLKEVPCTDVDCETDTVATTTPLGAFVGFLSMVSYFWTHQNVVRTTVAGSVATWWFSNISACTDSFQRAMTYSFGSICFGSLIVAILQAVREQLRRHANQRNSILRCIAECILVYIERLAEYFNKWAFLYVGIYGYGYVDAGKAIMNLFQVRGWTAIISDNLVNRLLNLVNFSIGLCSGLVLALVTIAMGRGDDQSFALALINFVNGMVCGMVLSGIVMGVVSSSVDTVIVLFAESPAEFQMNHPTLSEEMVASWAAAWPNQGPGVVVVSLDGGVGII